METLTTKDILELCPLSPPLLNQWICRSILTPAVPGRKGPGNSHRFTVMQSVGIMVATAVHQSEQGCTPTHTKSIFNAFDAMTEKELLSLFEMGFTHFATVHEGEAILTHPTPYLPDVRQAYFNVKGLVATTK